MSQPGQQTQPQAQRQVSDQEEASQRLLDGSADGSLLSRVSRLQLGAAVRRALSFGRRTSTATVDEEAPAPVPASEARQSRGSDGPASPAPAAASPPAPEGELCTATSAPASLEEGGERRESGLSGASSLPEAVKASAAGSPSTLHSIFGRLLRSPSGHLQRANSTTGQQPVCLICLENLGPEDFESGEAMQLECQCRGELALRHRACAEKWSRVKGDRMCDICKAQIVNLPEVTPRASSEPSDGAQGMFEDEERHNPHGFHSPYMNDQIPGSADVIFDCIRVTWVAMIICILFFEMNLAMALWTGLIVGLAYTCFARAMYRTQLAAIQREMARDRERAAHVDTPSPPMVVVH